MAERFSLRSLYLYLVCLITLVISIFAGITLVQNAVELAYPDPAPHGEMLLQAPREPGVTEEELQRREAAMLESQRRHAILGLIGSGTTLLIALPLYAYHWRRVQRERLSRAHDTSEEKAGA